MKPFRHLTNSERTQSLQTTIGSAPDSPSDSTLCLWIIDLAALFPGSVNIKAILHGYRRDFCVYTLKHEANRITLDSVWGFALVLECVKGFFWHFRKMVGVKGPFKFNLGTRNADVGVSATMGQCRG
ncbi:MAG: hypothetical protein CM1200mP18_07870 [Gammaproteobacteria bacterium]|nr:MAG: hypothetical protein CM1200mP18_07870 [Gammaproteobacteria bacterium]